LQTLLGVFDAGYLLCVTQDTKCMGVLSGTCTSEYCYCRHGQRNVLDASLNQPASLVRKANRLLQCFCYWCHTQTPHGPASQQQ